MASFFGFDPSKPPERTHNSKAPGFGPAPDPFAGFSKHDDEAEVETFDFEDEYNDDLGNRLEEEGDDFNDDTFGAGPVGTNFDFGRGGMPGQVSKQQQAQPQPRQTYPTRQPSAQKPAARTGYESYKQSSGRMPDLAPNASIWGTEPTRQETKPQSSHGQQPSIATATRKMMSVEEVEAMMRSQTKKPPPQPPSRGPSNAPTTTAAPPNIQPQAGPPAGHPMPNQSQMLQRPPQYTQDPYRGPADKNLLMRGQPQGTPQPPYPGPQPPHPLPGQQLQLPIQTRDQPPSQHARHQPPSHPRQILQHPERGPQSGHSRDVPGAPNVPGTHGRGPSLGGRPVTHPDQITQLSEGERAAFLLDEANRAKRNHKIHLLSKDNGLMTPQDKNFITRIQLQQLVTATGGTDEAGPESMLAEDFYYQVFSQIRGAPRQENQFAQTYLNQLTWRGNNRRQQRGPDNHMRRMEQQVQRAVEAAKARPKNRQLIVEGSLGKISFSNAKTPKPLLNLKRQDSHDTRTLPNTGRARQQDTTAGRKAVLKDIEAVYAALMKIEDHERRMPPSPREESSADEMQGTMDWRQEHHELNAALWKALKVRERIVPNSPIPHPFIAILSHSKGKKLVPRVFRQIDDEQRTTILTIIVVQLDMLDVIRFAQPSSGGGPLPAPIRAEIALFAQAVEPNLFAYISDAPITTVTGLAGLLSTRTNLATVLTTRTGVNLLTRLLSRAVLVLQTGHTESADASQWTETYNHLFDLLEPQLPYVWQTPVATDDGSDFYVWQFLAAVGIGAGVEQQQRLVVAVKDRVMDTVGYAKGLGEVAGKPRLDMVNLFMHAIGLDVDLLG